MPARTGPDHRARPVMTSDKVRPHHLERKALLYVRQSSAHQVLHNRESGALQYAMRDRLAALGWSEIEVIDDDLGRSAAGRVQRAGFERMVAASMSRQGRRRVRPRGLALRPQQPGLAAADRDVPRCRYCADRHLANKRATRDSTCLTAVISSRS